MSRCPRSLRRLGSLRSHMEWPTPQVHQDFDRQKLYEEVWVEPVTKVSKRYGISDGVFVQALGILEPVLTEEVAIAWARTGFDGQNEVGHVDFSRIRPNQSHRARVALG